MTIKKKVLILIFIISIYILFLFISTKLFFFYMNRGRALMSNYHKISFAVENISKDFWRLRAYVREKDMYNFAIHNSILKEIEEIKDYIKKTDLDEVYKRKILYEYEVISSFLNQYRNMVGLYKQLKEDQKFTSTLMDSQYFSMLFYLTGAEDPRILSILPIMGRSYFEYRIERSPERFFNIRSVIEELSERFENDPQFLFLKEYVRTLNENLEKDYRIAKRLEGVRYQLNYISERFENTLGTLESSILDLININSQKLSHMRNSLMNMHLFLIFFAFSGVLVYIVWFLRSILLPIGDLSRVAKSVLEGNLGIRFTPRGKDELSVFGSVFNDMLEKIETTTRKLKRERDRAERADALKGELIRRISHELKTPLNSVMGFSEVLLGQGVTDDQKRYLDIILKESNKLKETIEKMVSFSSLNEYLELKEEFNLVDVINNVINIYREKAKEKGLTIEFSSKIDPPTVVIGYPLALDKVFRLLVDNAVKFTQSGGIEIGISERKGERDVCVLCFYVRDTGIGIPKEEYGKIFEDFYQIDPILTRRYSGMGLGLSIAKRLIEEMGGHIWVESRPNEFTIFRFTLKFELPESLD